MVEELPKGLRDAHASGRLLPFVGAGVSMDVRTLAGARAFPSWEGLLELAAKRLGEEGRPQRSAVEAMLGQTPKEYLAAAHYAKKGLGALWPKFLGDAIGIERDAIDPDSLELARAVWGLGSKLVITTNYDRVLRWACPHAADVDEWRIEAKAELVAAQQGTLTRPAVWHLHGAIGDAANIILAPDGYSLLYPSDGHQVRYEAALTSLRSLLVGRHFVFLGFSLDDQSFVRQLEWLAQTFAGCAGPHYVLVRERDIAGVMAKVAGLDVQAIGFSEFGKPLVELVQRIAGSAPVRPVTVTPTVVVSPANPNLAPGDVLVGRYRLIEKLGQGAFAAVWQALDLHENRLVAIKALHVQHAADARRRAHFEQGAEAMKTLLHSGIARILAGPHQDGHHHFFVMPWYRGGDLRHALRRGLDRRFALEACARAIEGLAAVHARGWVHGDVKPDNVLLDEAAEGVLGDFDFVRDEHPVTSTVGASFVYAAPELYKGARHADARADVYGAGMTVLFALLGEDPPPLVALAEPHRIEQATGDVGLRGVLRGALAYDPAQRTTTCAGLIAAIRGMPRIVGAPAIVVPKPAWPHESGQDEFGKWATLRIEDVVQTMRWIPPGVFTMGSPDSEEGRDSDEGPQHQVRFTQGFWLASTACTQAMWAVVMGSQPSEFQGVHRPVEQVSWDDVQEFMAALNARVPELDAALPSEARWEYACRAGTVKARYGELNEIAWHEGNSGGMSHDVGLKSPNSWGLHDMLGNVWEWCADTGGNYEARGLVDPPPREHGPERVYRGGAWINDARDVRAAYRYWYGPGDRDSYLGFRLAGGQRLRQASKSSK